MNAQNRLNLYRKRAEATQNEYYKNWRVCRYGMMKGYRKQCAEFTHNDGKIYADSLDVIGCKVADAHEIINLNYTGFFCDSCQSGVIRGAVVKLRSARGTHYIPATYCTEWDVVTLYISNAENVPKGADECAHDNAKREAARSSDHYANREAETARDDDAKFQAEQKIEEYREEITQSRAEVREIVQAIREQRQAGAINPVICKALINKIHELREYVRDRFANIAELKNNYWLSVDY
jgi:hypothetical protein